MKANKSSVNIPTDVARSMSDSSDFGDNAPVSDGQIERVLRHTVEKTYKSDQEQLTVRRLRTKVEQELGLDDGFFKGSAKWNVRSKDVIQSEVVRKPQSLLSCNFPN